MSFGWWINVALVAGTLLWAQVYFFFADDPYIIKHFAPPALALGLHVINSLLVSMLRNPAFKVIGMIWVTWPVVGTYFSLGHFYQRKLWASLDLAVPDIVFTISTMSLLIGLHLYCALFKQPSEPAEQIAWRPVEVLPLLVFPLAYGLTLISSGGTLLSGTSVVDSMYSIDRGPIYSMRIALVPALGFLALYAQRTSGRWRWVIWSYILVTLLVSVLDGKRDIALLGVLAMLFVSLSSKTVAARGGRITAALVAAVFAYGVLSSIRADKDLELGTWVSFATIAGVEYRDFAHSVNYWSPEYMQTMGYDFLSSSLGALLNGEVLSAVGFNKSDLIQQDSARAWQRLSLSDFGIRTGLVSELYFAFPIAWAVLIGAFGFCIGAMHRWTLRASGDLGRMMATTAISAATLAVFSQTSATLGFVMSLIYLAILLTAWRFFLSMTPLVSRRHT